MATGPTPRVVTIGGEKYRVEQAVDDGHRKVFLDTSMGLGGRRFFVRGTQQPVPEDWYVLEYPDTPLFGVLSPAFLERLVDAQPTP